jgi:hypothetical protein
MSTSPYAAPGEPPESCAEETLFLASPIHTCPMYKRVEYGKDSFLGQPFGQHIPIKFCLSLYSLMHPCTVLHFITNEKEIPAKRVCFDSQQ